MTEQDPLAVLAAFADAQGIDTNKSGWRLSLPAPPKGKFATDKTYDWVLETGEGTIRVRLMPEVAPQHVSSTAYLTQLGYYDGLDFHRVITGFMAQGGCPEGSGRGGPGYQYDGEFSSEARHDRPGILSMANAGPGTDGSQFFLTFGPTPHLDGNHTVFGRVVDGMDAVKAIEGCGSGSGAPQKAITILSAKIEVGAS